MIKSKITKKTVIALAIAALGFTSVGTAITAKSEVNGLNGTIEVLQKDLEGEKAGSKKKDEAIKIIEKEKADSDRINKNTIDKLNNSLKEEKKKSEDLSLKLDDALSVKIGSESEKEAPNAPQSENESKTSTVSEQSVATAAPAENSETSQPTGGRQITVQATAYDGVSLGGLTASGYQIQGTGDKVIAVDPNVIPMGSTVYIPGYGTAIARDTGGAIQGNIIDLNMSTAEAVQWGRQTVTITVY